MKKITNFLLVTFFLMGSLHAQITTYPYSEDFETGPAGWTLGGITSTWALGAPANTIINSAASGDSSWVTNLAGDYAPGENGWVESPVFDFSMLNAPSIQARVFWNSEFSWDGMVLQSSIDGGTTFQNVGAFGDPNNWYNDNSLNGAPGGSSEGWTGTGPTGSGGWVTATHSLTGLNNQSSVILRFAFGSDTAVQDEGVGFDLVEIFDVTCPQPTALSITNLAANSVDLGWTEAGTATSWDIQWGGAGFTLGTGAIIPATTTNPNPLTGLVDNTNYDFYVRAICGMGDTSVWTGPFTFLTPCVAFPSPWFDDVETHATTTSFSFSECWTSSPVVPFDYDWNIGQNTSTGSGPLAPSSGANYFYTDPFGNTGDSAFLNLPTVNVSTLTNPTLSFFYHMFGNTMGDLFVEVFDGTNWVQVDVISGQQQTSETDPWLKRFVDLTAFGGSNVEVRFKAINAIGCCNAAIAIDDIGIQEVASCPEPNSLGIANLTANSVDLTWMENGTATAWDIEWGGAGFTQGTGAIISNTTTNPHSLTGLIDNTCYDFYVRADCGANDSSLWVGPFTFCTPCIAFNAPWFDDVENHATTTSFGFSECWTSSPVVPFDYDWNIGQSNAFATGPSTPFSGSNYFYTDPFGNTGDTANLNLPIINVSALLVPTLEFRYHMFGSTMGDLFVEVFNGTNWIQEDAIIGQQHAAATDLWSKRFVDLSAYAGGNVQVRFRAINTIGCCNSVIAIDDINIQEVPSCPEPNNLGITNLTDNSVDLTWMENASATTWDIEWGGAGFTLGTGAIISNTTTNPHSLTGLISETCYDFYVRADCGAGDSSLWVGPFNFCTPCTPFSAPYIDSVETHTPSTTFTVSECWTTTGSNYTWDISGGTTPSGGTGPNTAFSGNNYFFTEASSGNAGDSTFLISPLVDLSTLSNPVLEFYYHMFGGDMGDLFIEVSNGGPFVVVESIIGSQQALQSDPWLKRFVSLSAYLGNTVQIRFRAIRGNGFTSDIAIDDISLIEAPSCPQPSTLSAANITASSADLTWIESGSAPAWQIEWGPTGFTPGPNGNGTVINTGSNPFNLTGLMDNTNYSFYVTAICGMGDTSITSGPFNFLTPCSTNIAPWLDNVDSHATSFGFDFSECWTASGLVFSYEWNIGTFFGGPTPFSGANYFYTDNFGNLGDEAILNAPSVDISTLATPTLQFRYHMFGEAINTLITEVMDSGGLWTPIDTLSGQIQTDPTDPWLIRELSLSGFNGDIQVRFRASALACCDGSAVSIDDINVIEQPTCPEPSFLSVNNITTTTADLNWTELGAATEWQIEWDTIGFTQGSGNFISTASVPETLTGLDPASEYCFFVRAVCGAGDSSLWVGPLCFTTIPDYCAGDLFVDNGGLTGNYDSPSNDTTVICPNNTFGDTVRVTFNSFDLEIQFDSLFVYNGVGTSSLIGGFSGNVSPGSFTSSDPSGCLTFVFTADPSVSLSGWDANVDCLPTTCSFPSDLNANNITSNSATLNWTDNAGAPVWQIEWDTVGFVLGTGNSSTVGGNSSSNIASLNPNTEYCFYVTATCGFGNSSAVTGPYCFTTQCFNVDLGVDTMPCQNDPFTLDAGAGANFIYLWSNGETTQTITLDTNDIGFAPTPITVTVTDSILGCSVTDTVIVNFGLGNCTVGIDENGNNIGLSIYPNPNKGIFILNVVTDDANELDIKVTNLQGQIVFSKSNFKNLTNVNQEIDLENQSKGIYFVTVTTDKGTTTNKIVVQ